VFISHATEDKEKVARPLAEALREQGLDVWYDEFSLNLGDNLQESIDKGIRESRYGIVILSKSFFEKKWPQKELSGFIAREIHGKKLILPVWHELEFNEVLKYSPTLADRVAARTNEGIEQVVNKIMKVIKSTPTTISVGAKIQPLVDIYANKDAILIGRSIRFFGHCINGGSIVKLTAIKTGEHSKWKEIASPTVSASGEWSFEWAPDVSSESGEYLMKVADSLNHVSDVISVRIEKGAVTMVAHGRQVYYLGEKVRLSGTSTVPTKEIYLSIKQQGLFTKQKKIDQLKVECENDMAESFTKVKIETDNTWSFVWDTSLVASTLKKGYYTIYATEVPRKFNDLNNKGFSKISIVIEQPFVSVNATVSQSIVAQGNRQLITGVAKGTPQNGVQIWIFGEESSFLKKVEVNPDSSFSLELSREETKQLSSGQYFVVVQHPMMNNEFDVYLDAGTNKILSDYPDKGTDLFSIGGPQGKRGADAAISLVKAINNPEIDDTYTKLQFLIEKPEIRIDPISDKHIGEQVKIAARTNLSVGDEVFFEFSFVNMDPKNSDHVIGTGATIIANVKKGEGGWNQVSFKIDTSTFLPGKYMLLASAITVEVKSHIFFMILED